MVRASDLGESDRRAFLRRAGLAVGIGAVAPLLRSVGGAAASPAAHTGQNTVPASSVDADALFRAGRFTEAERGYRRALRRDPQDAHAHARVGYIALLSNRFGDAETYLSTAIDLDPDDIVSKQRLAECFVRQDQHARAIPLLRQTGSEAFAVLYTHLTHLTGGTWQVHGAPSTRVPFLDIDPLPAVEASVNGGAPKRFLLDTFATLDLERDVAEEAGLRAVATVSGVAGGTPVERYLGILGSFRVGDIEVRNLPVQWTDTPKPPLPDGSEPGGVIGTTVLYHLVATMDYAGRALVLRRKTPAQLHEARRQAARTGFDRLPLWLAGDHFPCTLGSLLDDGPRMVTLDTGGIGHGLDTTVEVAERVGIEVDYDHPVDQNGTPMYPIAPERINLGRAVGHHVPGFAAAQPFPGLPGPGLSEQFEFDLTANFTHEFFKPFAITFDYTHMHLYITGDLAPR